MPIDESLDAAPIPEINVFEIIADLLAKFLLECGDAPYLCRQHLDDEKIKSIATADGVSPRSVSYRVDDEKRQIRELRQTIGDDCIEQCSQYADQVMA
ncbi:MAG: hypothetical protein KDA54_05870 [Phycisphaerales bacterium]|nr:hypothetical protein [Phycisphaerales bacterium]